MQTLEVNLQLKDVLMRMLNEPDENCDFIIEKIIGGGNNRSYKVIVNSKPYFLKHYYADNRKRLATDYNFSYFAFEDGIRCIAKPIAFDEDKSIALYDYISGRKISSGELCDNAIKQAIGFILELNRNRFSANALKLPIASEACFSLLEHVQLVDERVNALEDFSVEDAIDPRALDVVQNRLVSIWQKIRKNILEKNSEQIECVLGLEERILSPSDFGFHNALLVGESDYNFFDFEYAGWDDPAKLVADFFLQPSVQVPMVYFADFACSIANLTKNPIATEKRIKILFPLFSLKWSCIVLNCFTKSHLLRKKFVNIVNDDFRRAQIVKAEKILDLIEGARNYGIC